MCTVNLVRLMKTSEMKALLLLTFVVYANAQLAELSKGFLVHLGPFDTSVQIGNSSERYFPFIGDDALASKNARILVEEARRLFRTGFNRLPPLDPYRRLVLPPLSLGNYLDLVKGHLYLKHLVIDGAKRFRQNLLELRFKTGRVDFGFTIPLLNFNVDFETDVVLAGSTLPLDLKGHLSLLLSGVKVLGNLHIVPRSFNYGGKPFYQVVGIQYSLHIDDVAVQLQGPNANINKLIEDGIRLGIDVLEHVIPANIIAKLIHDINVYAAKIVLSEANNMLLLANTDQVLAYLLPEHVC